MLDEVGSWNASWSEFCDTLHDLSGQVDCLQSNTRPDSLNCYGASPGKYDNNDCFCVRATGK